MPPIRVLPRQIHHVALHVRDVKRSAAFLCDLFGFVMRPATPPTENVCICATPMGPEEPRFEIVLIQGLPGGTQPLGMDHLGLEVSRAEDVEDIYAVALSNGVEATEPRVYGGFYQTFVFDPDGYKIEVVARELPARPNVRAYVGVATRDRSERGALAASSALVRASTTRPVSDAGNLGGVAAHTRR